MGMTITVDLDAMDKADMVHLFDLLKKNKKNKCNILACAKILAYTNTYASYLMHHFKVKPGGKNG